MPVFKPLPRLFREIETTNVRLDLQKRDRRSCEIFMQGMKEFFFWGGGTILAKIMAPKKLTHKD